jgi:fermentation-respiration switch protein FrsA (DUF1100 family)
VKRAKRLGAIVGITLASCLVALVLFVMIFENRFIDFPSRDGNWDLPKTTLIPVEDVSFRAEDGVRLHGWFARGKDAKWTLLWFHGNAGNVTDRFNTMIDFVDRLNVNVFLIDYRGYGRSEGSPDEKGLYGIVVAIDAMGYGGGGPRGYLFNGTQQAYVSDYTVEAWANSTENREGVPDRLNPRAQEQYGMRRTYYPSIWVLKLED